MNTSHQFTSGRQDPSWLKLALALLDTIQQRQTETESETEDEIEELEPVPSVIFCRLTNPETTMSSQQSSASARGGRQTGVINYGTEETMHLLNLLRDHLPIGQEQWKVVTDAHTAVHPHCTKESLVRKCQTLHQKKIPTGDPECPEDVKLAKTIKYEIGNKACLGDAEEDFDLEEVGFGETSGNPKPFVAPTPSTTDAVAEGTTNMSTISNTTSTPSKRQFHRR